MERFVFNTSGAARHETLEGRDYLVAPISMLAEGVWPGSEGPIFYPGRVIGLNVMAWNHKPIVIYHPTANDGSAITAADPVIINTRKAGIILNTIYDNKLRTEGWFDEEKTRKVDSRVYEALIAGMPMEVSTGVVVNAKDEEGEFGGKKYSKAAQLLTPDHLAVLPDKIGAYSIADGAGLFQMNHAEVDPRKIEHYLDELKNKILANCGRKLVGNELAASTLQGLLNLALQAKYAGFDGYVDEIFQSFFVFYSYSSAMRGLYKMEYTSSDSSGVTLVGDPVQVFKTLVYRAVEGGTFVGNSTTAPHQKEEVMPKKETIDKLIANGDFAEDDRKLLEGFTDARLDDMLGKSNARVTANSNPPAPATPAPVPVTQPAPAAPVTNQATFEELLAKASPEYRTLINNGLAAGRKAKADAIAIILANNEKSNFNKEWLEKQDLEVLEPIARGLAPSQTMAANNFLGAAGAPSYTAPSVTTHNEKPLSRPAALFGADAKA